MRDKDYILDLSSLKSGESGDGYSTNRLDGKKDAVSGGGNEEGGGVRAWVAVKWKCCGTYSRIYKNKAGDAYEGRCPKCMRPVRLRIGEGGTNSRFFEVK